MEREKVLKIMEQELNNQPMASQEVRDSNSALGEILEEYIIAVQRDAFYF